MAKQGKLCTGSGFYCHLPILLLALAQFLQFCSSHRSLVYADKDKLISVIFEGKLLAIIKAIGGENSDNIVLEGLKDAFESEDPKKLTRKLANDFVDKILESDFPMGTSESSKYQAKGSNPPKQQIVTELSELIRQKLFDQFKRGGIYEEALSRLRRGGQPNIRVHDDWKIVEEYMLDERNRGIEEHFDDWEKTVTFFYFLLMKMDKELYIKYNCKGYKLHQREAHKELNKDFLRLNCGHIQEWIDELKQVLEQFYWPRSIRAKGQQFYAGIKNFLYFFSFKKDQKDSENEKRSERVEKSSGVNGKEMGGKRDGEDNPQQQQQMGEWDEGSNGKEEEEGKEKKKEK